MAQADAWFAGVASSLQAGKPVAAQLNDHLASLPGAELNSWMAESCAGSYPLSVIASSRSNGGAVPIDGQFLVLTVGLSLAGAPWIGAAPVIVGRADL
jgi:hypothetical protein